MKTCSIPGCRSGLAAALFILCLVLFTHASDAKQRRVHGRPWYKSARIFYDWIRIGEDLNRDYARHLVAKTLASNCNTLAFCVHVGGYALWNSEVTPKYDRIGGMDLIGELADLCAKEGIYFVPWWLGTTMGVAMQMREHPSWAFLGPPRDGQPPRRWHYVCYNSPYRDLLYEEVREILAKYEVDGIYFDQLPGSCYCPFCREKFERLYNQPMPIVPEEEVVPLLHKAPPAQFPPLLREFRNNSIRGFCAGIRKVIDEVRPGTCYIQNWINGYRARLGVGLVDVVLPEFYQANDLIPLGMKHRITRSYFDNGAVWGNVRHSVYVDARHFPLCGTRMLLVDCVANQAAPLMLDLCAMDFDPTGTGELAETFSDIAKMYERISTAEEVPYAVLLHSLTTYENHLDAYMEGFEGWYRLLFEAHIPFDIISEQQLQRGGLGGAKVLIVPDAVFLEDATVRAIRSAVKNGVGLVTTHLTGMRDADGSRRSQPALADLLGIRFQDVIANDTRNGLVMNPILNTYDIDSRIFYYGSGRTGHELAGGLPEKCLFSFQGGFVACQPAAGAGVFADIHPPDHSRLYAREYNRRGVFPDDPRWPLAIARTVGDARAAYFAAQADAQWRRAHSPELTRLMENAVTWAGGTPPISTRNVPNSVEVRLFREKNRGQVILLLVNHSTNPLSAPGDAHIGVIRYITPHRNLKLQLLMNGTVRSVTSLAGNAVKYTREKGELLIELSYLHLYDALIVDYDE